MIFCKKSYDGKHPQSLYAMFFSSLNMVIVLLVVQVKVDMMDSESFFSK